MTTATTATISSRSFLLFSASVLAWVLVLSLTLKLLFGAGMSGGWLIVGTMFSMVVAGAIVMVKEIQDAILPSAHIMRPAPQAKPPSMVVRLQHPNSSSASRASRPHYKRILTPRPPRREALGLNPELAQVANRRRWALVSRRGPTFQERFRYCLISANLACLIRQ